MSTVEAAQRTIAREFSLDSEHSALNRMTQPRQARCRYSRTGFTPRAMGFGSNSHGIKCLILAREGQKKAMVVTVRSQ